MINDDHLVELLNSIPTPLQLALLAGKFPEQRPGALSDVGTIMGKLGTHAAQFSSDIQQQWALTQQALQGESQQQAKQFVDQVTSPLNSVAQALPKIDDGSQKLSHESLASGLAMIGMTLRALWAITAGAGGPVGDAVAIEETRPRIVAEKAALDVAAEATIRGMSGLVRDLGSLVGKGLIGSARIGAEQTGFTVLGDLVAGQHIDPKTLGSEFLKGAGSALASHLATGVAVHFSPGLQNSALGRLGIGAGSGLVMVGAGMAFTGQLSLSSFLSNPDKWSGLLGGALNGALLGFAGGHKAPEAKAPETAATYNVRDQVSEADLANAVGAMLARANKPPREVSNAGVTGDTAAGVAKLHGEPLPTKQILASTKEGNGLKTAARVFAGERIGAGSGGVDVVSGGTGGSGRGSQGVRGTPSASGAKSEWSNGPTHPGGEGRSGTETLDRRGRGEGESRGGHDAASAGRAPDRVSVPLPDGGKFEYDRPVGNGHDNSGPGSRAADRAEKTGLNWRDWGATPKEAGENLAEAYFERVPRVRRALNGIDWGELGERLFGAESGHLDAMSPGELADLIHHGTPEQRWFAITEGIRREGLDHDKALILREHQHLAGLAVTEGIIQMETAQGKTATAGAAAPEMAVRHGVVQLWTSSDYLASRDYQFQKRAWQELGFDVVEYDPDRPAPVPRDGKPMIVVTTPDKVAFGWARAKLGGEPNTCPGDVVVIDEIEKLLADGGQWCIKDADGRVPTEEEAAPIREAWQFFADNLRTEDNPDGMLTEVDFGLRQGRMDGTVVVSDETMAKARTLFAEQKGRPMEAREEELFETAARAKFQFIEKRHYFLFKTKGVDGRETVEIVLNRHSDGMPLRNKHSGGPDVLTAETFSKSRLQSDLGMMVDAKHEADGVVMGDGGESQASVNVAELLSHFRLVRGLSGTADLMEDVFVALGYGEVMRIDRFAESGLEKLSNTWAPTKDAKWELLADRAQVHQSAGNPVLIRVDTPDEIGPSGDPEHGAGIVPKLEKRGIGVRVVSPEEIAAAEDPNVFLEQVTQEAGKEGKVTVCIDVALRGNDYSAETLGKPIRLLSSGYSSACGEINNRQFEGRGSRPDRYGPIRYSTVEYFVSPEDLLFDLPHDTAVVDRYRAAVAADEAASTPETQAELRAAEEGMNGLIPGLHDEVALQLRRNLVASGAIAADAAPPEWRTGGHNPLPVEHVQYVTGARSAAIQVPQGLPEAMHGVFRDLWALADRQYTDAATAIAALPLEWRAAFDGWTRWTDVDAVHDKLASGQGTEDERVAVQTALDAVSAYSDTAWDVAAIQAAADRPELAPHLNAFMGTVEDSVTTPDNAGANAARQQARAHLFDIQTDIESPNAAEAEADHSNGDSPVSGADAPTASMQTSQPSTTPHGGELSQPDDAAKTVGREQQQADADTAATLKSRVTSANVPTPSTVTPASDHVPTPQQRSGQSVPDSAPADHQPTRTAPTPTQQPVRSAGHTQTQHHDQPATPVSAETSASRGTRSAAPTMPATAATDSHRSATRDESANADYRQSVPTRAPMRGDVGPAAWVPAKLRDLGVGLEPHEAQFLRQRLTGLGISDAATVAGVPSDQRHAMEHALLPKVASGIVSAAKEHDPDLLQRAKPFLDAQGSNVLSAILAEGQMTPVDGLAETEMRLAAFCLAEWSRAAVTPTVLGNPGSKSSQRPAAVPTSSAVRMDQRRSNSLRPPTATPTNAGEPEIRPRATVGPEIRQMPERARPDGDSPHAAGGSVHHSAPTSTSSESHQHDTATRVFAICGLSELAYIQARYGGSTPVQTPYDVFGELEGDEIVEVVVANGLGRRELAQYAHGQWQVGSLTDFAAWVLGSEHKPGGHPRHALISYVEDHQVQQPTDVNGEERVRIQRHAFTFTLDGNDRALVHRVMVRADGSGYDEEILNEAETSEFLDRLEERGEQVEAVLVGEDGLPIDFLGPSTENVRWDDEPFSSERIGLAVSPDAAPPAGSGLLAIPGEIQLVRRLLDQRLRLARQTVWRKLTEAGWVERPNDSEVEPARALLLVADQTNNTQAGAFLTNEAGRLAEVITHCVLDVTRYAELAAALTAAGVEVVPLLPAGQGQPAAVAATIEARLGAEGATVAAVVSPSDFAGRSGRDVATRLRGAHHRTVVVSLTGGDIAGRPANPLDTAAREAGLRTTTFVTSMLPKDDDRSLHLGWIEAYRGPYRGARADAVIHLAETPSTRESDAVGRSPGYGLPAAAVLARAKARDLNRSQGGYVARNLLKVLHAGFDKELGHGNVSGSFGEWMAGLPVSCFVDGYLDPEEAVLAAYADTTASRGTPQWYIRRAVDRPPHKGYPLPPPPPSGASTRETTRSEPPEGDVIRSLTPTTTRRLRKNAAIRAANQRQTAAAARKALGSANSHREELVEDFLRKHGHKGLTRAMVDGWNLLQVPEQMLADWLAGADRMLTLLPFLPVGALRILNLRMSGRPDWRILAEDNNPYGAALAERNQVTGKLRMTAFFNSVWLPTTADPNPLERAVRADYYHRGERNPNDPVADPAGFYVRENLDLILREHYRTLVDRYQALRVFIAVAEELDFTQAAQRLGMPVRRFYEVFRRHERRFGAALFDPATRSLTENGIEYLEQARTDVAALEYAGLKPETATFEGWWRRGLPPRCFTIDEEGKPRLNPTAVVSEPWRPRANPAVAEASPLWAVHRALREFLADPPVAGPAGLRVQQNLDLIWRDYYRDLVDSGRLDPGTTSLGAWLRQGVPADCVDYEARRLDRAAVVDRALGLPGNLIDRELSPLFPVERALMREAQALGHRAGRQPRGTGRPANDTARHEFFHLANIYGGYYVSENLLDILTDHHRNLLDRGEYVPEDLFEWLRQWLPADCFDPDPGLPRLLADESVAIACTDVDINGAPELSPQWIIHKATIEHAWAVYEYNQALEHSGENHVRANLSDVLDEVHAELVASNAITEDRARWHDRWLHELQQRDHDESLEGWSSHDHHERVEYHRGDSANPPADADSSQVEDDGAERRGAAGPNRTTTGRREAFKDHAVPEGFVRPPDTSGALPRRGMRSLRRSANNDEPGVVSGRRGGNRADSNTARPNPRWARLPGGGYLFIPAAGGDWPMVRPPEMGQPTKREVLSHEDVWPTYLSDVLNAFGTTTAQRGMVGATNNPTEAGIALAPIGLAQLAAIRAGIMKRDPREVMRWSTAGGSAASLAAAALLAGNGPSLGIALPLATGAEALFATYFINAVQRDLGRALRPGEESIVGGLMALPIGALAGGFLGPFLAGQEGYLPQAFDAVMWMAAFGVLRLLPKDRSVHTPEVSHEFLRSMRQAVRELVSALGADNLRSMRQAVRRLGADESFRRFIIPVSLSNLALADLMFHFSNVVHDSGQSPAIQGVATAAFAAGGVASMLVPWTKNWIKELEFWHLASATLVGSAGLTAVASVWDNLPVMTVALVGSGISSAIITARIFTYLRENFPGDSFALATGGKDAAIGFATALGTFVAGFVEVSHNHALESLVPIGAAWIGAGLYIGSVLREKASQRQAEAPRRQEEAQWRQDAVLFESRRLDMTGSKGEKTLSFVYDEGDDVAEYLLTEVKEIVDGLASMPQGLTPRVLFVDPGLKHAAAVANPDFIRDHGRAHEVKRNRLRDLIVAAQRANRTAAAARDQLTRVLHKAGLLLADGGVNVLFGIDRDQVEFLCEALSQLFPETLWGYASLVTAEHGHESQDHAARMAGDVLQTSLGRLAVHRRLQHAALEGAEGRRRAARAAKRWVKLAGSEPTRVEPGLIPLRGTQSPLKRRLSASKLQRSPSRTRVPNNHTATRTRPRWAVKSPWTQRTPDPDMDTDTEGPTPRTNGSPSEDAQSAQRRGHHVSVSAAAGERGQDDQAGGDSGDGRSRELEVERGRRTARVALNHLEIAANRATHLWGLEPGTPIHLLVAQARQSRDLGNPLHTALLADLERCMAATDAMRHVDVAAERLQEARRRRAHAETQRDMANTTDEARLWEHRRDRAAAEETERLADVERRLSAEALSGAVGASTPVPHDPVLAVRQTVADLYGPDAVPMPARHPEAQAATEAELFADAADFIRLLPGPASPAELLNDLGVKSSLVVFDAAEDPYVLVNQDSMILKIVPHTGDIQPFDDASLQASARGVFFTPSAKPIVPQGIERTAGMIAPKSPADPPMAPQGESNGRGTWLHHSASLDDHACVGELHLATHNRRPSADSEATSDDARHGTIVPDILEQLTDVDYIIVPPDMVASAAEYIDQHNAASGATVKLIVPLAEGAIEEFLAAGWPTGAVGDQPSLSVSRHVAGYVPALDNWISDTRTVLAHHLGEPVEPTATEAVAALSGNHGVVVDVLGNVINLRDSRVAVAVTGDLTGSQHGREHDPVGQGPYERDSRAWPSDASKHWLDRSESAYRQFVPSPEEGSVWHMIIDPGDPAFDVDRAMRQISAMLGGMRWSSRLRATAFARRMMLEARTHGEPAMLTVAVAQTDTAAHVSIDYTAKTIRREKSPRAVGGSYHPASPGSELGHAQWEATFGYRTPQWERPWGQEELAGAPLPATLRAAALHALFTLTQGRPRTTDYAGIVAMARRLLGAGSLTKAESRLRRAELAAWQTLTADERAELLAALPQLAGLRGGPDLDARHLTNEAKRSMVVAALDRAKDLTPADRRRLADLTLMPAAMRAASESAVLELGIDPPPLNLWSVRPYAYEDGAQLTIAIGDPLFTEHGQLPPDQQRRPRLVIMVVDAGEQSASPTGDIGRQLRDALAEFASEREDNPDSNVAFLVMFCQPGDLARGVAMLTEEIRGLHDAWAQNGTHPDALLPLVLVQGDGVGAEIVERAGRRPDFAGMVDGLRLVERPDEASLVRRFAEEMSESWRFSLRHLHSMLQFIELPLGIAGSPVNKRHHLELFLSSAEFLRHQSPRLFHRDLVAIKNNRFRAHSRYWAVQQSYRADIRHRTLCTAIAAYMSTLVSWAATAHQLESESAPQRRVNAYHHGNQLRRRRDVLNSILEGNQNSWELDTPEHRVFTYTDAELRAMASPSQGSTTRATELVDRLKHIDGSSAFVVIGKGDDERTQLWINHGRTIVIVERRTGIIRPVSAREPAVRVLGIFDRHMVIVDESATIGACGDLSAAAPYWFTALHSINQRAADLRADTTEDDLFTSAQLFLRVSLARQYYRDQLQLIDLSKPSERLYTEPYTEMLRLVANKPGLVSGEAAWGLPLAPRGTNPTDAFVDNTRLDSGAAAVLAIKVLSGNPDIRMPRAIPGDDHIPAFELAAALGGELQEFRDHGSVLEALTTLDLKRQRVPTWDGGIGHYRYGTALVIDRQTDGSEHPYVVIVDRGKTQILEWYRAAAAFRNFPPPQSSSIVSTRVVMLTDDNEMARPLSPDILTHIDAIREKAATLEVDSSDRAALYREATHLVSNAEYSFAPLGRWTVRTTDSGAAVLVHDSGLQQAEDEQAEATEIHIESTDLSEQSANARLDDEAGDSVVPKGLDSALAILEARVFHQKPLDDLEVPLIELDKASLVAQSWKLNAQPEPFGEGEAALSEVGAWVSAEPRRAAVVNECNSNGDKKTYLLISDDARRTSRIEHKLVTTRSGAKLVKRHVIPLFDERFTRLRAEQRLVTTPMGAQQEERVATPHHLAASWDPHTTVTAHLIHSTGEPALPMVSGSGTDSHATTTGDHSRGDGDPAHPTALDSDSDTSLDARLPDDHTGDARHSEEMRVPVFASSDESRLFARLGADGRFLGFEPSEQPLPGGRWEIVAAKQRDGDLVGAMETVSAWQAIEPSHDFELIEADLRAAPAEGQARERYFAAYSNLNRAVISAGAASAKQFSVERELLEALLPDSRPNRPTTWGRWLGNTYAMADLLQRRELLAAEMRNSRSDHTSQTVAKGKRRKMAARIASDSGTIDARIAAVGRGDAVDLTRAQLDELIKKVQRGATVYIEGPNYYMCDFAENGFAVAEGNIPDADRLATEAVAGLIAVLARHCVRPGQLVIEILADNVHTTAPSHADVTGNRAFHDPEKRHVFLTTTREVLEAKFPGIDIIVHPEDEREPDALAMIDWLNEQGCVEIVRDDDGNMKDVYFVVPEPKSPQNRAHKKVRLMDDYELSCVALDVAGPWSELRKPWKSRVRVKIFADTDEGPQLRTQQDEGWELLRYFGIPGTRWHNLQFNVGEFRIEADRLRAEMERITELAALQLSLPSAEVIAAWLSAAAPNPSTEPSVLDTVVIDTVPREFGEFSFDLAASPAERASDYVQPVSIRAEKAVSDVIGRLWPELAGADPVVRRSTLGDLQSEAAFALARHLSTARAEVAPAEVATRIVAALDEAGQQSVAVSGPGYLNIVVPNHVIWGQVTARLADPERLGIPIVATNKKKVKVYDYSSPNAAKPPQIWHMWSTVIGDALVHIDEFLGEEVVRQNHLGDWGTPVGMVIEFLHDNPDRQWQADPADVSAALSAFGQAYKDAKERSDADPDFLARSQGRVVAFQAGDPDSMRAWEPIIATSKSGLLASYRRLGVSLTEEHFAGESFYQPMLPVLRDKLVEMGIAVRSDGALVVESRETFGPDDEPVVFFVEKSDGGYGYDLTDLAALVYRVNVLGADEIVIVTDARQSPHFLLVEEVARRAGLLPDNVKFVHVGYGTVVGPNGRPFATRAGKGVPMTGVLDEAVDRARVEVAARNPGGSPAEIDALAEKVGIGVVKYAPLSNSRTKDYAYDLERLVSSTGDTSVYIQYAHARAASILHRSGTHDTLIGPTRDLSPTERSLALRLDSFGDVLLKAQATREPHRISRYLSSLARDFNKFYENNPVLRADEADRGNRLALCDLTAKTLRLGLGILGIAAPERMSSTEEPGGPEDDRDGPVPAGPPNPSPPSDSGAVEPTFPSDDAEPSGEALIDPDGSVPNEPPSPPAGPSRKASPRSPDETPTQASQRPTRHGSESHPDPVVGKFIDKNADVPPQPEMDPDAGTHPRIATAYYDPNESPGTAALRTPWTGHSQVPTPSPTPPVMPAPWTKRDLAETGGTASTEAQSTATAADSTPEPTESYAHVDDPNEAVPRDGINENEHPIDVPDVKSAGIGRTRSTQATTRAGSEPHPASGTPWS
ncbi:arginine--tRNA ligase [Nocardia sp. NPDC052278]|uniref:arginine--tRNA ligase n=1 Tax=unclassified Nocardia TaxID=2637762 RepID=UPI00368AD379